MKKKLLGIPNVVNSNISINSLCNGICISKLCVFYFLQLITLCEGIIERIDKQVHQTGRITSPFFLLYI